MSGSYPSCRQPLLVIAGFILVAPSRSPAPPTSECECSGIPQVGQDLQEAERGIGGRPSACPGLVEQLADPSGELAIDN